MNGQRIKMKLFRNKTRTIFMDHASTSPMDSRVLSAMMPYFQELYFNANSLYAGAVSVKNDIQNAREGIAKSFNAHPDEIVFTRGGTESDNIAILGIFESFKSQNPDLRPHIVTTNFEHPAVRETLRHLKKEGQIELTEVPVNKYGVVDPKDIYESLRSETILVSVMQANNEIGSIQDVREISKMVRKFKKHKLSNTHSKYPLVHTDASQSVQFLNSNVLQLGVDLLTANGSKIYGPKGGGILFVKRGTPIQSILFGGDQENGLRPGTPDTPTIIGLAKAFEIIFNEKESEVERLGELQGYLAERLESIFSEIISFNGSLANRLPNNINVSFKGLPSDLLVIELDARGVYVSSRSACKSDDPDESYVLQAINGKSNDEDEGSIRISFGRETTIREIDILITELGDVIDKYRKSGLYEIN